MALADVAAARAGARELGEREGARRHKKRLVSERFSVLEGERSFVGRNLRSDDVKKMRFKAELLRAKSEEAAVEASGIGNAEFARRGNVEEHVLKRLNLWKIEEALLFFSVRHEV